MRAIHIPSLKPVRPMFFRELTQVQLEIVCEIDQSQAQANLLLGETIVISSSKMGLQNDLWSDTVEIVSTGGGLEWDTTGDVVLRWSALEVDGGESISIDVELDSLSLDLQCEGDILRVME